jgi:hypothetical protein
LNALPNFTTGVLLAAILIFSLVRGLIPSLSGFSLISKVAKPASAIFSSALRVDSITLTIASNAAAVCLLVRPAFSATALINSPLFIFPPFLALMERFIRIF